MNSSKNTRKSVGTSLRDAREKHNLTQEEVAKKAHMTTNYYAMIERGEVNPSFEKLKNLAKVLKVKLTIS